MGSRRQDVDVKILILEAAGARRYIQHLVEPARHDHFEKMSDEDVLEAAKIIHKEQIRFAQSDFRIAEALGQVV